MAPRPIFNPVKFYREAASAKPLSVAAPQRRRPPVSKVPLSFASHAVGGLATLAEAALKAWQLQKEKDKEAAAEAEMQGMISALTRPGGQRAYDAVFDSETDGEIDATYEDCRSPAPAASERPGGMDAVRAGAVPKTRAGRGMLLALTHDEYRQRREREAAELKRSRELSDTAADRAFRAEESDKTRAAADARHEAATRQRLEYFGATQKAAQERILDERKYKRDEKEAEDAIVKAKAEEKKRQQLEGTAVTQDIMGKALDGAFAALAAAKKDPLSLGAAGTLSQIPAILSSSHGGRLRSHIKTLKSPIVMGGIENLRKSSAAGATGFGAMNKEELGILINRLGALDPDTTDDDILWRTLDGIRKQVAIVKKDVVANVRPDRLRAIGLGHWLPKRKAPTAAEAAAELKRRGKSR